MKQLKSFNLQKEQAIENDELQNLETYHSKSEQNPTNLHTEIEQEEGILFQKDGYKLKVTHTNNDLPNNCIQQYNLDQEEVIIDEEDLSEQKSQHNIKSNENNITQQRNTIHNQQEQSSNNSSNPYKLRNNSHSQISSNQKFIKKSNLSDIQHYTLNPKSKILYESFTLKEINQNCNNLELQDNRKSLQIIIPQIVESTESIDKPQRNIFSKQSSIALEQNQKENELQNISQRSKKSISENQKNFYPSINQIISYPNSPLNECQKEKNQNQDKIISFGSDTFEGYYDNQIKQKNGQPTETESVIRTFTGLENIDHRQILYSQDFTQNTEIDNNKLQNRAQQQNNIEDRVYDQNLLQKDLYIHNEYQSEQQYPTNINNQYGGGEEDEEEENDEDRIKDFSPNNVQIQEQQDYFEDSG